MSLLFIAVVIVVFKNTVFVMAILPLLQRVWVRLVDTVGFLMKFG